ncbi:MAG: TIGR04255 family protein [Spirochaetia bacterium]|nr:TIGR04255 family protein [Spirochaetia bacterium]
MENCKIPLRLGKCPIIESVVEIRFKSVMPEEAVFGMIYAQLSKHFNKPKKLPILQLPEAIRNSDPNLKYQAYYSLQSIASDDLQLNVGPRGLVFANTKKYVGWDNFAAFIETTLSLLKEKEVITEIERIGVRYINLFHFDIFDKIEVKFQIGQTSLSNETTTFRTEFKQDDLLNIINITNRSTVKQNGKPVLGSLIDLDVVQDFNDWKDWDYQTCVNLIGKAHEHEKIRFFNLLKPEFVATLDPEY